MRERELEAERLRNTRFFETETKAAFIPQELTSNTVGRKVMKT